MGTNSINGLEREHPSALAGNLSRDDRLSQVCNALTATAKALLEVASAIGGKDVLCPVTENFAPDPEGVTVKETVNLFLRAKSRAGRSDRYLRALRVSLNSFADGRANLPLASVDVCDLEKWLDAHDWKPRTQQGYLSDVRVMFNFAVRRGLVRHNPAAAVEPPQAESKPPEIHSPIEVSQVMEFARSYDLNLCRALAIRYFAGLRSAEANRTTEKDIYPEHIEVTARNSKTRQRRLVTISPALRSWLDLGGELNFGDREQRWRWFVKSLATKTGVTWPHNVTRHSFVSYHLAASKSAALTALEAGHTEQMLFAHYRALVTPAQAVEFWNIRPK